MSTTLAHKRTRDDLRDNHWRRVVVPEVYRLYGYVCHICHEAIDPNLKSPHPMSRSIDHILGRATGYDVRFLRPAHRSCNVKRGDPTRKSDPKPKTRTQW